MRPRPMSLGIRVLVHADAKGSCEEAGSNLNLMPEGRQGRHGH
jgi:hypothetical protein